ncbi:unnamed protein product [Heterobilharzia americana]|nr:unnamed protein product [Heterobilharzia americana]CAH8434407.1 unnamed protein product [Heterobilharzia americana]
MLLNIRTTSCEWRSILFSLSKESLLIATFDSDDNVHDSISYVWHSSHIGYGFRQLLKDSASNRFSSFIEKLDCFSGERIENSSISIVIPDLNTLAL